MIRSSRLAMAAAVSAAFCLPVAWGNPEGAQVVQGAASFSTPSSGVLNIRNSNGAVINWQRFDIAPGETTRFIQPSADSSVLNRVVGNNPSRILGTLSSNGRVFLINQNGLLVGEGATIDTAGFFGSTLNLTDEDFLNGRLRFEGGGQGGIVNRGFIRADGGNIVLIAPNIENGGVIRVRDGEILLAAGQSIELTSIDNPSIRFEVSAPDNHIVNLGRIIAERGAASLFAGSLRHSGAIRATGLVRNADGSIALVAKDSVTIDGSVDASGETGGGAVHVEAQRITVGENGVIDASATAEGDGGEVVLFAEDSLAVHGEILARGGAQGGDGGFIETSGLKRLDIRRAPDASAANGRAGQWLIDPNDITIQAAGADTNISNDGNGGIASTDDGAVVTSGTIETALNAGTSVVIQTTTSGADSQAGNITVLSDITTSSASDVSLTLQAHNDIIFDTQSTAPITLSATGTGALTVDLQADSDGDGSGLIQFLTGIGNAFPITFNTNGGRLLTNRDAQILGENALVLVNTDWLLDTGLYLDFTAQLNLSDAAGNNRSLVVGRGGFLHGEGSVNGDVDMQGGALAGSTQFGFGSLIINGRLNFDHGLLFTVIGGLSTDWASSEIFATTVDVGQIDLMLVWENAFTATGVTDGTLYATPPLNLLSCGTTGCMTGNVNAAGIGRVVDPLAVTSSAPGFANLGVNGGTALQYGSITTVNGAEFNEYLAIGGSWGGSTASDWSLGRLPIATDYVILPLSDSPSPALILDTAESVTGVQAVNPLWFMAGGQLSLTDRFVTLPGQGTLLTDASNSLSSSGGIELAPGSTLLWQQGSIAGAINNWGRMILGAPAMALTGDLVNRSVVHLAQGANLAVSGTAAVANHGLFDTADATLRLDNGAKLLSASADARFLGAGRLELAGTASLDLAVAPAAFSPDIQLIIDGGSIDNAANLVFPNLTDWNSGTVIGDLNLLPGRVINLNGAGPMVYSGGTWSNAGTTVFQSAGANLQLDGLFSNTGLLNLAPTAAAGIAGSGQINQPAGGGSMSLSGGQDFTLAVPMNNAGDLIITAGNFLVDGVALSQTAGAIDIAAGAELRVLNGGLLDIASGVIFNAAPGAPRGSLSAALGSVVELNDAGIDLGNLQSLALFSNSRVQGVGGAVLPAYTRLQNATLSGTGTLTLAAGMQLDTFTALLTGVDTNNRLVIDAAGAVHGGATDTLSLEFADLNLTSDGLLDGNGIFELLDDARLIAGLTTQGAQNVVLDTLYLRRDGSELVANGMDFSGRLVWYHGQVSGSGLTTSGSGNHVGGEGLGTSPTNTPNRLLTDWTIGPGATVDWRGERDLLLDTGSIINQGELTITLPGNGTVTQKSLTRVTAFEGLVNEGLLLADAGTGKTVRIASGFDNAGGGIGIVSGTLIIDANGDGLGDTLLLDQAGEFLQGFGIYDGSVDNQAGFVSPGRNDAQGNVYQTGVLTLTGNYRGGANGLLRIDLDSTASGLQADQLAVQGDLLAGGTLSFNIINNKSVLEIAALIDQSFRPLDIGGAFVNGFDSVIIPDGLNFTLGPNGLITITSDSPLLNRIADELQALLDNSDLTYAEVADALRPPERRIGLIRSRLEGEKERKRRRGGPRLVCR